METPLIFSISSLQCAKLWTHQTHQYKVGKMKSELNINNPNDAWILHREESSTIQDGSCNIYVLIDGYSACYFGHEISVDLPTSLKILNLFKKARKQANQWPKQVLISKSDPLTEELEAICKDLKIPFKMFPKNDLRSFVEPISDALEEITGRAFRKELPEIVQGELEAFIPETYGPCPCASGKKFKFCCQKVFKEITFAMCAAQEGDLNEAIKFMDQAESKVGKTVEILCRYAICWSFFDKEKSQQYLAEAIATNPNHPRTNYILGIEAKAKQKYDKAIEYYKNAIDNYPKEDKFHLSETYNNLGTTYLECRKFAEAKAAWEKALVLFPSDQMVRNNLIEFIYENHDVPPDLRKISPFIERYLTGFM